MPPSLQSLLEFWISFYASAEGFQQLQLIGQRLERAPEKAYFFMNFSRISHWIDRIPLSLSQQELSSAQQLVPDWRPDLWNLRQIARVNLLLIFQQNAPPSLFQQALTSLFETGDLEELVTLYQSLILLPQPESYQWRATEGLRSNMMMVFQSIALNNPYPHHHLNELAWNQMILKAIFTDCNLNRIQGLSERNNPRLRGMIADHIQERQSAGRPISQEVWAFVRDAEDHKWA